jgi:probable addiction module antidote protein
MMGTKQKRNYRSWRDHVREEIKDPAFAAEYLTAAAADDDSRSLVIALKDIIDVYGGLSNLSRKANLNRGSLHRALTGKGDIKFDTLHKAMAAAGFEFKVKAVRSVIRENIAAIARAHNKKIAKKA